MALAAKDTILHFSLLEGQARAVMIESTNLVTKAKRTHALSETATIALGRLLTGTAILGDMIKNEKGSLTVTVKGGGPLGALVAVGYPGGVVKGYVDKPYVEEAERQVGEAVGRDGYLTVVRDSGMREPYVGQVALVSGEIAEDLCSYLATSEQTPSLLSLGVHVKNGSVTCAGGLLVQMLPGASEAAIQSVEMSVGMFSGVADEIDKWGIDEAAKQLLSHLQMVELERSTPEFRCDCSRERVERALITLGPDELRDMITRDHGAQASCHFCNRVHRFSEADLLRMIEKMKK